MARRQVEIVVAGSAACRHPASGRQPIVNGLGVRIAERCGACHRIVHLRQCKGCIARFRATTASIKHGKIYHSTKCRGRAASARRAERANLGGNPATDGA